MDNRELNERKKLILKAIVEAHVRDGGPVGSKYLTQDKQIALSSATIRNEMAELEEMGYLKQPHTSAGRIPSEYGYRFYVNRLMQKYRMSAAELRRINSAMRSRISELDSILENVPKIMSSLTNYTSLAVKPRQRTVIVAHFKTMLLGENIILLVMLMNTGAVKTKQLRLGFRISQETLTKLEMLLNAYVAGVDPSQITLQMMMELEAQLPEYEQLISPIIKVVYEVINEIDSGDLKLSGVDLLLQYPEYADIERFKSLLGMLEKKDDLLNLISNADRDSVQVYIGSENSVDIMKSSSLVFKTVVRDGRVVGAIGVLGPCRMDYSKVITVVDYLAGEISGGLNPGLDSGGNNRDY